MPISARKQTANIKTNRGRIYVGTSGFSYHEWIGTFYPPGTKGPDMLRYYATQLNTVEVNNTFYRLPSPEVIQTWKGSVGPDFRFTIKASQQITHRQGFGQDDDFFDLFLSRVALFKERAGTVLFQFPPYFGDADKLLGFAEQLGKLPKRILSAVPVIEVRSPKLLNPDLFAALTRANVALCLNDEYLPVDQWPEPGRIAYLRLREETYPAKALNAFAQRLQTWSAQGKDCYVYFQHEGRATELARELKGRMGKTGGI